MAHQLQRSRSSHSIRSMNRPLSRASTQSAMSPAPDFVGHDMQYQQAYMAASGPEAALLSYAGTQNGMGVDPMLQQNVHAQQMMPQYDQYQQRPFTPQEEQYLLQSQDYSNSMQIPVGQPIGGLEPEDRRRKNSAATATNDKELRELLARNEQRGLKDVAQEVIQKERTPQAEKTKQLFAMLWLRKVCKTAKTSVPRNRVYSHYANKCGTERVVPLNPASFGKLVRVIFPGIQTRRLGVRGESKYHYVDLCLQDDEAEPSQAPMHNQYNYADMDSRRSASAGASLDFGSISRPHTDTAAFPVHDSVPERVPARPDVQIAPSQGKLFAYPDTRGMGNDTEDCLMYEQQLRFVPSTTAELEGDDSITLPGIHAYCPPKTDPDTAEALMALYRTHCTSLIDCIRFCKEKQFFRLFTSFHGTLTVPVQKLFSHPNLAPWIEECDWLMYQKMVRFVSRLTLQAAPPVVITILNNISTNLHAHIRKTFQSHPNHVLQAKLKPAATFASLLHRLIRVNAAAHAAANLLTIDQNREQMWREWVTMVNPKRVMEGELPACGYDEAYKILTCDIRGLLEPLNSPPFPDNPMFNYDNQAYSYMQAEMPNAYQSIALEINDQTGQISTENVLERWSAFLSGLPGRFPQASTRTLLHCISAVGTAALRDITIMGGASYQTWWVMKIFVDEMSLWLAAMGGFLERTPVDPMQKATADQTVPVQHGSGQLATGAPTSGGSSRLSSLEADLSAPAPNGHSMRQGGLDSNAQISRSHSAHTVPGTQSFVQSFAPSNDAQAYIQPKQNQHEYQHQLSQSQSQPQQQPMHEHFSFQPSMHDHQQQQQPLTNNHQSRFQEDLYSSQHRHDADIDDSGIGMSLTDDDLNLSKFGMSGHQISHEMLANSIGVNVI